MDVQRAEPGNSEQRGGQDRAVRGNDEGIGMRRAQTGRQLGRSRRIGLQNLEPMTGGEDLDRARRETLAATGGPVRLRQDKNDLMAGPVQRLERLLREFRSAGKN
jgi:hypothetical protein